VRNLSTTRISQPEMAVTSSRCLSPTHGPSSCANSKDNAAPASRDDHTTSDRHCTLRAKVHVRMNMPTGTQMKLSNAVKVWIQPVVD